MKAFVAGVVAGAAIMGIAWWLASAGASDAPDDAAPRSEPSSSRRTAELPAAAPRRDERAPEPARAPRRRAEPEAESETPPASTDHTPFAPGEAWLHAGESYVFGETSARRRGEQGDIRCLDIQSAASLSCPHGAAMADVPLGAVGVPNTAVATAALVADAPAALKPFDTWIGPGSNASSPGVLLVRAASGATYKLAAVEIVYVKDVLSRAVRVQYAEVPAREGGGRVAVAGTTPARDATTLAELKSVIAAGNAIPNASFANFLKDGEYQRLSSAPAELVIEDGKSLLLDEPLATRLEYKGSYGSLVAGRGIAATGKLRIGTYTGVAVRGDMAGELYVGSYAYVHISGNLTGKLPIHSYATVVIDGDLVGEVEVSSYTTLLLRGRLLGKLTIKCGGSKFWFQQYMARSALEALDGNGNEAHLQTSDCGSGTLTDVRGWAKVAVGEDAWKVIAK